MARKNRSKMDLQFEQLLWKFVKWAEAQDDIHAVIVVGSRARVDHPADEWSDLDITVATTNPERYLSTADWLENIGKPLITFLEPTAGGGGMERRVLFEGMLDVDFAIFPIKDIQYLVQNEISQQVAEIFGRGTRILLDKDGMASQIQLRVSSVKTKLPSPPNQHEFLEVVNDFWYHIVWTIKKLKRGELWTAKFCLDSYLKWKMLRMIEWHSRAENGWTYDTWHNGRFLEEWAGNRILEGLRGTFAHYDKYDIERALLAIMNTFRWVATETAEKLDYPYPIEIDKTVTEWVETHVP